MSAASLSTATSACGTLLLIGVGTHVALLQLSSRHVAPRASNTQCANMHDKTTATAAAAAAAAEEEASTVAVVAAAAVDTAQVRAVAFVHGVCGGGGCDDGDAVTASHVVYAGDGKRVCFCRLQHTTASSSSTATATRTTTTTQSASARVTVDVLTPSCVYGPHTKRITHLAVHRAHDEHNSSNSSSSSSAIVFFADKFGEVYRLHFVDDNSSSSSNSNNSNSNSNSNTATAVFALQHFSVLTVMTLLPSYRHCPHNRTTQGSAATATSSLSLPWWLVTCDKDAHVRLSDCAATHNIVQYLWPPQSPPTTTTTASTTATPVQTAQPKTPAAVVTCMTDVLLLPPPSPLFTSTSSSAAAAVVSSGDEADEVLYTMGTATLRVCGARDAAAPSRAACYVCITGHSTGSVHVWTAMHAADGNITDGGGGDNSNDADGRPDALTHACALVVATAEHKDKSSDNTGDAHVGVHSPVTAVAFCAPHTRGDREGDNHGDAADVAAGVVVAGAVLVAYERSRTVYMAVARCARVRRSSQHGDGDGHAHDGEAVASLTPAVTLEATPLAMLRVCDAHTVVVLQRNGSVTLLQLTTTTTSSTHDEDNSSSSSIMRSRCRDEGVVVCATRVRGFSLVQALQTSSLLLSSSCGAACGDAAALLASLDVCASWRYDAVDPRTAKQQHGNERPLPRRSGDDDDDNDNDDSDDSEKDSGGDDDDAAAVARKKSLNPLRTHDPVPAEVKAAVSPITYTPAPDEARERGLTQCPLCLAYFGWLTRRSNCDWCGRELCARCCPPRHLLGDQPACPDCTRRAFQQKRQSMLQQHYNAAGLGVNNNDNNNDNDNNNSHRSNSNNSPATTPQAASAATDTPSPPTPTMQDAACDADADTPAAS